MYCLPRCPVFQRFQLLLANKLPPLSRFPDSREWLSDRSGSRRWENELGDFIDNLAQSRRRRSPHPGSESRPLAGMRRVPREFRSQTNRRSLRHDRSSTIEGRTYALLSISPWHQIRVCLDRSGMIQQPLPNAGGDVSRFLCCHEEVYRLERLERPRCTLLHCNPDLTVRDREPVIGRKNRIYEILSRRRTLTLRMIGGRDSSNGERVASRASGKRGGTGSMMSLLPSLRMLRRSTSVIDNPALLSPTNITALRRPPTA